MLIAGMEKRKKPKLRERNLGFAHLVGSIYPLMVADKYSRFIRAIFSREIPLGHSTSQAPVIGTIAKAFQIHLTHHVHHTVRGLYLALWQQCKLRNFCRGK